LEDAFFFADGECLVATELTRGPWDPGAQHAGPPSALLARAIERLGGADAWRVGRITVEILRPVPIAPLTVDARVVRPGRRVEHVQATLSAEGEELLRASAWRLRADGIELPPGFSSVEGEPDHAPSSTIRPGHALPGPEAGTPEPFFETGADVGYHTAMEYRFVRGAFLDPGTATVWMRMRVPLVAGEEPTGLERVLVAADAGNGVSATLPWERFLFINVDLNVHVFREPDGEWVCLEAITVPEPSGVGLADTALYDERGPIGRATQTLLIADR
jgi:hypothetical protein